MRPLKGGVEFTQTWNTHVHPDDVSVIAAQRGDDVQPTQARQSTRTQINDRGTALNCIAIARRKSVQKLVVREERSAEVAKIRRCVGIPFQRREASS